MIRELSSEGFARVQSLCDHNGCLSMEPCAVIQGFNPGRVFVDAVEKPSAAVVWAHEAKGFYLVGRPDNRAFNDSLDDFFTVTVAPEARMLGYRWCEISGISCGWNSVIETSFSGRELTSCQQSVYLYSTLREAPPQPRLPDGFTLATVAQMRPSIQDQWGPEAASSRHGYGFCAVLGGEVASICYVCFRTHEVHGLGIETAREHRQRGLGKAVAAATVREVLSIGKRPYWDCSVSNLASAATARSMGFEKAWEYTCYDFRF